MKIDDVLKALERKCDKAGGQASWAKENNISPVYVSDALNKKREPGKKILDALGIEKKIDYRRKKNE